MTRARARARRADRQGARGVRPTRPSPCSSAAPAAPARPPRRSSAGIGDPARVDGPIDTFALRNPDMYVAGTRVNMVSSPAALAEQVPGMTTEQAASNAWWTTFFAAPDRIGWWLEQERPARGDRPRAAAPASSGSPAAFADPGPYSGRLVVCVTHSPLLRSVLRSAHRAPTRASPAT